MSENNSVLYELNCYVGWITLNVPERGNVVNNDNLPLIKKYIDESNKNPDCRVIVLQGRDGIFSRGMDFMNLIRNSNGGEIKSEFTDPYKEAVLAIRNSDKPVIGLIDGDVLAGGMGLALSCDIIISSTRSVFGLSEVLFGIIPAFVYPFLLERVSYKAARYMVLSSKRFNATEALRLGLVDEVVEEDRLNKTVKDTIKRILFSSPDALALVKKYSDKLTDNKIAESVDFAQQQLTDLLNVAENVSTIRAFTEGESTPWAVSYKPNKKS